MTNSSPRHSRVPLRDARGATAGIRPWSARATANGLRDSAAGDRDSGSGSPAPTAIDGTPPAVARRASVGTGSGGAFVRASARGCPSPAASRDRDIPCEPGLDARPASSPFAVVVSPWPFHGTGFDAGPRRRWTAPGTLPHSPPTVLIGKSLSSPSGHNQGYCAIGGNACIISSSCVLPFAVSETRPERAALPGRIPTPHGRTTRVERGRPRTIPQTAQGENSQVPRLFSKEATDDPVIPSRPLRLSSPT